MFSFTQNTTDIFGDATTSQSVSTFGTGDTIETQGELVTKLQKLYEDVGITLNSYIDEFVANHKNTEAIIQFSRDDFEQLASKIVENSTYDQDLVDYEKIRTIISNTLDLFQTSMLLYTDVNELEKQNAELQERTKILEDNDLLQEFLDQLKKNMVVFPEQTVQMTVAPMIKPEYLEYIKRYGMPENTIFDADKLGLIRIELGL